MNEKLAIGIDFGTTNSIAAAWGEDVQKIQPQPEAFWGYVGGKEAATRVGRLVLSRFESDRWQCC